ncbi:TonB-dependent receptor [Sphingomonas sp.]|uniref:TonB-dependent receptor n=1 Tax=Sphingomonas sp. TaxID=28214 RepID=UPI0025D11BDF|nr:TonB-dependent receptor [Sphingomonas sp.]
MINSTLRRCALLLASTALATPALAQTGAIDTPTPPKAQVATGDTAPESNEIIVTAQKREENLSKVPLSIQAIGTKRLDQLNISNFEQYTKQLPSVSFQTLQPGVTVVYMRGVATGGDGNHSGSLPSVGTYLDEQPVTTIGGTLDIHIYDIARIESLAGPQGTLYGASSQAGTIRIITNKPKLHTTEGRVDGEINTVAHGGQGGKLEGMINLPIADRIAFRAVGYVQHDAGYIDNVPGSRTYCGTAIRDGDGNIIGCNLDGISVNNNNLVKKNFNDTTTYGGRAALKIDLDDNWTVTPTVLHQNLKSNGNFSYDPALGDLKVDRFFPEVRKDKFTQAALTVEGKIGNFDITYAGAYLDRKTYTTSDYTDYSDAYDRAYSSYGGLANYFYYQDAAGNTIDPRQHITGTDHFKKMSQEFRIASPQDQPFRVIAGAFYQRQSNNIFQDYIIDNLGPLLSVNGRPGTLWLTKQKRVDKDYALFGEASFDLAPQFTITAGGRLFKYDNTLFGFAGFGRNPAYFQGADDNPPPNAAGSSRTGVAACLTTSGDTLRNSQLNGTDTTFATGSLAGTPCSNVADFVDGRAVPKRAKGNGFTHRLNMTFRADPNTLLYATWSRGFRPGGINRRVGDPYQPDYLTNYELGVKITAMGGAVHWNTAVYHQIWKKFQFSFLGLNSLTVIQNGRDATINGIESDISYSRGGLTLNAAAAYTDAKTKGNICQGFDADANCTGDTIVAPSGTRLPITPRFKGSATARYSWNLAGATKAHVQVGVAHQSSASTALRTYDPAVRTNPATFLGRQRAYTLVDAATGLDWRSFNVELYVANLFDKRNDLNRSTACSICTRTLIVPGTPRTIGLRAGYKF